MVVKLQMVYWDHIIFSEFGLWYWMVDLRLSHHSHQVRIRRNLFLHLYVIWWHQIHFPWMFDKTMTTPYRMDTIFYNLSVYILRLAWLHNMVYTVLGVQVFYYWLNNLYYLPIYHTPSLKHEFYNRGKSICNCIFL